MSIAHAMRSVILLQVFLFAAGLLAAETYRVNPANSSVKFEIDHLVVNTVSGRFHEFTGTVRYDPDAIERSSVAGTIQSASIDTGNENRDAHLRSADYFDVANHAQIRFQSKRVEQDRSQSVLVGDLTMRGVVREIVIPFVLEPDPDDGKLRFHARLELNRQDYGIGYGGFLDATVGDIVTITLAGEALRQ